MKLVKPLLSILVLAAAAFYWVQIGDVSQEFENINTQGSISSRAVPSQTEQENKISTQTQVISDEATSITTNFSEQTSVIEHMKTITLLAEQSLTIWPQGCNLVVLEKSNRRNVNDGESYTLEANSNVKRIIHLVEQGHFTYNKNTTRFSKKAKPASISERELEHRLSEVEKAGLSSCSSRYQISQA